MSYPFWHPKKHPGIIGILLLSFSLTQCAGLLSFHLPHPENNILGLFGYVSAYLWTFVLGPTSLLAILSIATLGILLLKEDDRYISEKHLFAASCFFFSLALFNTLLGTLFPSLSDLWIHFVGASPSQAWQFPLGGVPMTTLYNQIPYLDLEHLFGIIGTALIATTGLIISIILLFDIEIKKLFGYQKKTKNEESVVELITKESSEEPPRRKLKIGYQLTPEVEKKKDPQWQFTHTTPGTLASNDTSSYQLPSIELLHPTKKFDLSNVKKELKERADLLEDTLMNFNIAAKVGHIHYGPTITMFEVHPAVGVKVGKIKTLEHDIALNMEAKSIRIIAPIPGKAAVGIEIPNHQAQEVNFRELLASYQQKTQLYRLPLLLGKSANGEMLLTDLAKMPHCIIAGATGSGKSVCLNSIIMSILMNARPDEVKFLMIDPKKVELSPYTELPHMISPVITDPSMAAAALGWLVREMEKRYEILRITGQRNIESFNKRTINQELENQSTIPIPESLPYIVAIIDELADLMMVAQQDVEAPIARIAQMARAIGIHLILATQRPSREVITGLIKANFPARIACKVASRINSQIILDDVGAESLLGNGDMLVLLPGSSHLMRLQGVFIRDEEINRVIDYITQQSPPNYLIGGPKQSLEEALFSPTDEQNLDALFQEAKELVFSTGNASTTFLQRKLKIGYARAASIMDQLEDKGIVEPQDGARSRKINFPQKISKP